MSFTKDLGNKSIKKLNIYSKRQVYYKKGREMKDICTDINGQKELPLEETALLKTLAYLQWATLGGKLPLMHYKGRKLVKRNICSVTGEQASC